jgi:hypothetical protein
MIGAGVGAPLPTAPQAARPAAATISNAKSSNGARRLARPPNALSQIPAKANTMNAIPYIGKAAVPNPCGERIWDAAVYGVVATESVTVWGVAPGVIVADGAKEAAAPAGSGDTLNTTGSENAPFEGDSVKGKFAVWPGVTGVGEVAGVTE